MTSMQVTPGGVCIPQFNGGGMATPVPVEQSSAQVANVMASEAGEGVGVGDVGGTGEAPATEQPGPRVGQTG